MWFFFVILSHHKEIENRLIRLKGVVASATETDAAVGQPDPASESSQQHRRQHRLVPFNMITSHAKKRRPAPFCERKGIHRVQPNASGQIAPPIIVARSLDALVPERHTARCARSNSGLQEEGVI